MYNAYYYQCECCNKKKLKKKQRIDHYLYRDAVSFKNPRTRAVTTYSSNRCSRYRTSIIVKKKKIINQRNAAFKFRHQLASIEVPRRLFGFVHRNHFENHREKNHGEYIIIIIILFFVLTD